MARKRNVDGVAAFERDYRAFEQKLVNREVSHEEQVRATAFFLAHSFEIPVLELMRDQGFDAFCVKVEAGQFLMGPNDGTKTAFSTDDLRRIYSYCLKVLEDRLARGQLAPGKAGVH